MQYIPLEVTMTVGDGNYSDWYCVLMEVPLFIVMMFDTRHPIYWPVFIRYDGIDIVADMILIPLFSDMTGILKKWWCLMTLFDGIEYWNSLLFIIHYYSYWCSIVVIVILLVLYFGIVIFIISMSIPSILLTCSIHYCHMAEILYSAIHNDMTAVPLFCDCLIWLWLLVMCVVLFNDWPLTIGQWSNEEACGYWLFWLAYCIVVCVRLLYDYCHYCCVTLFIVW